MTPAVTETGAAMGDGRGSRELRRQLAEMSNAEIEVWLRAVPATGNLPQDGNLLDFAWEQLRSQERPRDRTWAGACLAFAECNYALRRYAVAQQAAAQAADASRRLGEEADSAVSDLLTAAALSNLGQHFKVIDISARARTVLVCHGKAADAALCDYVKGKALHGLGLYREAVAAYDTAKKVLLEHQELAGAARCDAGRGNALQALERYQEAIDTYEEAKAVFRRLDLPADAAACGVGKGIGLQGLGLYESAIDAYEEAKAVFRRLDLPADAAACDCSRGVALQSLERYREAIVAYEEAKPVLLRHGRLVEAAACDAGRGAALDSQGEYREAVSAFLAAKARYRACGDDIAGARCDLERGNALQGARQYDESVAAYRQARSVYSKHGRVIEAARCDANRGVALTHLGQCRKAMASFAEACPILEQFGQFRALAWAQCGLAVCQQAQDDRSGSLDSYLAACASLDRALEATGGEEKEFSDFREEFPDPYGPAIRLCLWREDQAQSQGAETAATEAREQAFALSERRRGAALRKHVIRAFLQGHVRLGSCSPQLVADRLAVMQEQALIAGRMRQAGRRGSTELHLVAVESGQRREQLERDLVALEEKLFAADPEIAGLLSRRLPALRDVLDCLAPSEGLISYVESNEDLICLLADRSGIARAQLLPGARRTAQHILASVQEQILECSVSAIALHARSGTHGLRELGTLLLDPAQDLGWFENGPSAKSRLRIVPTATLYALPFAALGLPANEDYLPIIQRVEVVTAPQAGTCLYQQKRMSQGTGMAAIIEPDDPSSRRRREAIEAVWPDVRARRCQDPQGMAPRQLADELRGRRYLYLSCRRSTASASLVSELYEMADCLDLAFVDIQDDDSERPMDGQELFVLARAFLHVSRQAIFSLWGDRSQAGDRIVADFYKAFSQGNEPAAALAWCQRQAQRSQHDAYGHPYRWARLAVNG